jgi:hypothetical protein
MLKLAALLLFSLIFNKQNPIRMPTLKTVLILIIALGSFTVRSQAYVMNGATYIGKTMKQINKINQTAHIQLFRREKSGRLTSLVYDDSLNLMVHNFVFALKFWVGPRECFSYIVNVNDTSQFATTKTNLLAKCSENISNKRSIQVYGTKKYVWCYVSSGQLHTFFIERHREGRKYR